MRQLRHGRIEYLDAAGHSRGRERFSLLVDADGLRTLQVTCEIDATGLVRHVVQTVDRQFRPREAYVRVAKGGHFTAAGWLCFGPAGVEVASQAGARAANRVVTSPSAKATRNGPTESCTFETCTTKYRSFRVRVTSLTSTVLSS